MRRPPTAVGRPRPLLAFLLLLAAANAGAQEATRSEPPAALLPAQEEAARAVSPRRLQESIDFLAAPERGGRVPGSFGHRQARDDIRDRMAAIGLEPLGKNGDYLFDYPSTGEPGRFQRNEDGSITENVNDTGYNVVGLLRGSDPARAEEYLVLLAHYDHLGVTREGVPFAGAFDNAAGVAAALEVARVLKSGGAAPRRSIVFLITDDEEHGLRGAKAWLDAPTVPRDRIVLGISADPLGRRTVPDYGVIVVAGAERSPDLHAFLRETRRFAEHDVVFVHRNVIPRFSSDQDKFYEADPPIPAIWVNNPGMAFYHKTGDLPETIDYRILADSTRWLVRTLALAGNTAQRFRYEGVPPISAETARDGLVLLEGLKRSQSISEAERKTVEHFHAEIGKVAESGQVGAIPNARKLLTQCVLFLFQLAYVHPGPVPPPFPGSSPVGVWSGTDARGGTQTWTFRDDGTATWRFAGSGEAFEVRWRLDAATTPHCLDVTGFDRGPLQGKTLFGIAEFTPVGTLRWDCEPGPADAGGDGVRPTAFTPQTVEYRPGG